MPSLLRRDGYPQTLIETCAKEAIKQEPEQRYTSFRSCLDDAAPHRDTLPLGAFKAPADGWFVTSTVGRGCGTLNAYDLASGAAYRIRNCGSRGRQPAPGVQTERGRVPLSPLREAVWMVMLSNVREHLVRATSATFAVPKEIPISRPGITLFGSSGGFGCSRPSVIVSWSWMRASAKTGALEGQTSGQIASATTDCGDTFEYAEELLAIAEDAFDASCIPSPPPARVAWSTPGPGIERDSTVHLDDPALDPLRQELAKAASAKRTACTTGL